EAPGRPILYRTTPDFLRTFGLESLDELPEMEKIVFSTAESLPPETSPEAAEPASAPPAEGAGT
ncbi:MAG: SMC-Scp complex subunit ScpB, partial [Oscillospiraceae bacterium]|nr:SMC-Scp complex subunit ScpB [Oscillospiraceae bacterium]